MAELRLPKEAKVPEKSKHDENVENTFVAAFLLNTDKASRTIVQAQGSDLVRGTLVRPQYSHAPLSTSIRPFSNVNVFIIV